MHTNTYRFLRDVWTFETEYNKSGLWNLAASHCDTEMPRQAGLLVAAVPRLLEIGSVAARRPALLRKGRLSVLVLLIVSAVALFVPLIRPVASWVVIAVSPVSVAVSKSVKKEKGHDKTPDLFSEPVTGIIPADRIHYEEGKYPR